MTFGFNVLKFDNIFVAIISLKSSEVAIAEKSFWTIQFSVTLIESISSNSMLHLWDYAVIEMQERCGTMSDHYLSKDYLLFPTPRRKFSPLILLSPVNIKRGNTCARDQFTPTDDGVMHGCEGVAWQPATKSCHHHSVFDGSELTKFSQHRKLYKATVGRVTG